MSPARPLAHPQSHTDDPKPSQPTSRCLLVLISSCTQHSFTWDCRSLELLGLNAEVYEACHIHSPCSVLCLRGSSATPAGTPQRAEQELSVGRG